MVMYEIMSTKSYIEDTYRVSLVLAEYVEPEVQDIMCQWCQRCSLHGPQCGFGHYFGQLI